jgi:hypothetical protein
MTELSITLSSDAVSADLRDLYAQTGAKTLVRLAGKTVETELRRHFMRRNSQGNKQGWPSKGLWRDIGNRTALGAVGGGALYASAEVAISHPAILIKIFGGTITPKRGKYLAIPAHATAYAAGSPREGATPELKVAYAYNPAIGSWMKALIEEESSEDSPGAVWYWLARKTTHTPDPDALPGEAFLQSRVDDTIESYLRRQLTRAA